MPCGCDWSTRDVYSSTNTWSHFWCVLGYVFALIFTGFLRSFTVHYVHLFHLGNLNIFKRSRLYNVLNAISSQPWFHRTRLGSALNRNIYKTIIKSISERLWSYWSIFPNSSWSSLMGSAVLCEGSKAEDNFGEHCCGLVKFITWSRVHRDMHACCLVVYIFCFIFDLHWAAMLTVVDVK